MKIHRLLGPAVCLLACSSEPSSKGVGPATGGLQGMGGNGAVATGGGAALGSGGIPMNGAGGLLGGGGLLGSGGTLAGAGGASAAGGSFGGGGMASEGGAGGMVVEGAGGMIVEGAGGGSAGAPPVGDRQPGCEQVLALPAIADYGAKGPYPVMRENNTGPSGQYTMWRPTDLGADGQHPPVSWGNGVTTTPDAYVALLDTVASHGFVVIASNSATMTAQLVRQGYEWLVAENASTFGGNLAVDCGATIGYSMGGGSAIGAGNHPGVRAVVSLHGLSSTTQVSGPLLLINATSDGFVSKQQFTVPTYNGQRTQPTIMATLSNGAQNGIVGHLVPLNDAGDERAPLIAWLRLWLNGDDGARPWFYGPDCTVCTAPWIDVERKNHSW